MNSVPNPVPGSLEEASLRFREFLRARGWPDQVQWLTAESALFSKKGHYWIKAQNNVEAFAFAHQEYRQGVKRGLGISIEALCQTDSVTFAYVFVPTDQEEAERLLITGLKLSVPLTTQRARVVENSCRWWVLRRLHELPIDIFPTR